jgi:putative FmdB family regulatory protein
MPIYAYRCASCGHARDVLQKLSDPVLTVCPACGAESFSKQLTAAGFQLKGSGWYVTDFRNGSGGAGSGKSTPAAGGGESAAPAPAPAPASEAPASGTSGGGTSAAPSTGGCGGSCACH